MTAVNGGCRERLFVRAICPRDRIMCAARRASRSIRRFPVLPDCGRRPTAASAPPTAKHVCPWMLGSTNSADTFAPCSICSSVWSLNPSMASLVARAIRVGPAPASPPARGGRWPWKTQSSPFGTPRHNQLHAFSASFAARARIRPTGEERTYADWPRGQKG
jgi:hypothetical protein